MLNLSKNRIEGAFERDGFKSFDNIRHFVSMRLFVRSAWILLGLLFIFMFLPWQQNIRSTGKVTTLYPNQRPQQLNSIIAGRIERWFVREGDLVEKGDTLVFLSEIKDDYFDPKLLDRTEEQIQAKELTVDSYMSKIRALDKQIDALARTKKLKIEQAENYIRQARLKIASDSIDLIAARKQMEISEKQQERMEQLYRDGLNSLTEVETRRLKAQEAQAKYISAENKLISSRNDLLNAQVELTSIDNQYQDKLAKAESEKFTALSNMYDAEALVSKMQNQYMNYSVRTGFYYITAPQDGYITETIKSGLGETVKEGENLLTIMPQRFDLAVEVFVRPMDLPLIDKGQRMRFLFDGWPSIVFSGWPNLSAGTFGGRIVAIDQFAGKNGLYRVLVAPDPDEEKWPIALRVGSGAKGIALLKTVPIWYELWRKLNGFPPDFYNNDKQKSLEKGSK